MIKPIRHIIISMLLLCCLVCDSHTVKTESSEDPWLAEVYNHFGLPHYWYEDLIQNEFTQAALQRFDEIFGDFDGKENIAISRITLYETMDGEEDYDCATVVFGYTHFELAVFSMQYSFSERRITKYSDETVFLNTIRHINESTIHWSEAELSAWVDFMSYICEMKESNPQKYDRFTSIFGETSLTDRGMYTLSVQYINFGNYWYVTYSHKTSFPEGNQYEYVWYGCNIDAQSGELRRDYTTMYPDIFDAPLFPFCK